MYPEKIAFMIVTIEEAEAHKSRSNWILMKNSEVNNKQKNSDGKIKTILINLEFQSQ